MKWLIQRPAKWGGDIASQLKFMKDVGGGSYLKGIPGFIRNELKLGQTFTKTMKTGPHAGKSFRYLRSPVGRVAGPLFTTGTGFGALTFMEKRHPVTGKKYGLGTRAARGLGEAALWSVAPGVAGAKALTEMAAGTAKI